MADLSTVWVQAKVYEYELPHIELGQPVSVTLPALPGPPFTGKVVFIQPTVEEATRTVQVRVELPNPDGLFKPGMFANIVITHDDGRRPAGADLGRYPHWRARHRLQGGAGRPLRAGGGEDRPVEFGDRFQVLDGLEAGDQVSTSANFLIDSESRLQVSGGGMAGMPGMDMGGKKSKDGQGDMAGMKPG